jgi:hypothetical protein
MKLVIIMFLAVIVLAGCSQTTRQPTNTEGAPDTKISECEAIKIAKQQVPDRIASAYTNSGFRQDLWPNGAWFVNFANVFTTPEEMGWVENETTYFNEAGPMLEGNKPGTYRNVVIFVDAVTGEVTGRQLHNGIILGPPGARCDE